MAKKKEKAAKAKWPPDHPEGEGPTGEGGSSKSTVRPRWDEKALVEALMKLEGVSEEIANHAAQHGVVDDAYVVQTFYRVSDTTAQAIIKAFKEAK